MVSERLQSTYGARFEKAGSRTMPNWGIKRVMLLAAFLKLLGSLGMIEKPGGPHLNDLVQQDRGQRPNYDVTLTPSTLGS